MSDVGTHADEEDPGTRAWERFGIGPEGAEAWRARHFTPFEAAIAEGDGFTPHSASKVRHQLRIVARRWSARGLESAEGLALHRSGVSARAAQHFRPSGADAPRGPGGAVTDGARSARPPSSGRAA